MESDREEEDGGRERERGGVIEEERGGRRKTGMKDTSAPHIIVPYGLMGWSI